MKKAIFVLSMVLVAGLLAGCYANRNLPKKPEQNPADQQRIVDEATALVHEMKTNADTAHINDLLPQAKGVLIFPGVIKAGFVFGGQGGNGVLLARGPENKWTDPAFYTLGGGSFGLQLGAERASIIMLFLNQTALDKAIASGLTLGADASVAGGNYGAQETASTTNMHPDVVYFSLLDGMFAGLTLEGGVVADRTSYDEKYYGAGATAETILVEQRFHNPAADKLKAALSQ